MRLLERVSTKTSYLAVGGTWVPKPSSVQENQNQALFKKILNGYCLALAE
jgi:hypothetical protein